MGEVEQTSSAKGRGYEIAESETADSSRGSSHQARALKRSREAPASATQLKPGNREADTEMSEAEQTSSKKDLDHRGAKSECANNNTGFSHPTKDRKMLEETPTLAIQLKPGSREADTEMSESEQTSSKKDLDHRGGKSESANNNTGFSLSERVLPDTCSPGSPCGLTTAS